MFLRLSVLVRVVIQIRCHLRGTVQRLQAADMKPSSTEFCEGVTHPSSDSVAIMYWSCSCVFMWSDVYLSHFRLGVSSSVVVGVVQGVRVKLAGAAVPLTVSVAVTVLPNPTIPAHVCSAFSQLFHTF